MGIHHPNSPSLRRLRGEDVDGDRAPDNVTLGGRWNLDGSRNESYPDGPVATPHDTNPIEEGVVISSGWKYIIEDLLDGAEIIAFSDWDVPNPEDRAWEFYKSYPRDARMYKVRIVKYERELIAQPARLAATESDRDVQDGT